MIFGVSSLTAGTISLDPYVPNYLLATTTPFDQDLVTLLDYNTSPATGWSGSIGLVQNGSNIIAVPYGSPDIYGGATAAWLAGDSF
jgi:hypothetical protein